MTTKDSNIILLIATLVILILSVDSLLSFATIHSLMMEDCSNALDDDDDGLIDLNDPDCICEILSPESLIPNPSFEESTCCPVQRSMLNCAVGWVQASEPTTDLIHPCGWTGWNGHFPPTPFPDGEAIMGFANGRVGGGFAEYNWKEYAGACLTGPLKANTEYRFEFYIGFTNETLSPTLDITFFGTTDCDNIPFGSGNPDLGCPTNGPNWKELGARNVGGGGGSAWVKTEITITPEEDIQAIAIGPPCESSGANTTNYYFFDNLVLADLRSFEFQISEVNHPCATDFTLSVPQEENISYQWYKNGIALIGETASLLSQIYGEGEYQVRTISDGSCLLTEAYVYRIPIIETMTSIRLCHDELLQFGPTTISASGNYVETLKNSNNCDSIVDLTVTVLPELMDTVVAKIFEGETFEGVDQNRFDAAGTYDVNLMNDIGCDSLVHLQLEYYHVYIPNVFTPNGDERNDQFIILGGPDLSKIKTLDIYDRWGQQVYSGTYELLNNSSGWDGKLHGTVVEQGIYSYITTLEMDDGNSRTLVGSVLVKR